MSNLGTMMRLTTPLAVLALAAGCGSTELSPHGPTSGIGGDTLQPDAKVDADGSGLVDATDTGSETAQPDGTTDGGQEETTGPRPGEIGYPCDSHIECFSDWCIDGRDGKVCTKVCEEDCPDGWQCKQVQSGDGDPVFLCVQDFIQLCRACEDNSDCEFVGGVSVLGARCVDFGADGRFCGGDCTTKACPAGYVCADVDDGLGGTARQCKPTDGEACDCTEYKAETGVTSSCYIENEHGRCYGARGCTPDGWGDCLADEPAEELCDTVDNDCDGVVDEGVFEPCTATNEIGTCAGDSICVGGELVCDAPEPEAEKCDGIDNDCNGLTDEGFNDADGDLMKDCVDEDDDDDGIIDGADNCPLVANPDQLDNDLDGDGDECDLDDDNDQVEDTADCAPFDRTIYPDAPELCDGLDNDCDELVDETHPDTDGDGEADCVDEDDDDDGVPDEEDNCRLTPNEGQEDLEGDGYGDACDPDDDNDGIKDVLDNCPTIPNATQDNTDNADDGGNACDTDDDDDGLLDEDDNCPENANPGQEDKDGDGVGDICDIDTDGDGLLDMDDNCPTLANPGQQDQENDGLGDICDPDDDNDLAGDLDDNCPLTFNPEQLDTDSDGMGNACDPDDDNDMDADTTDCGPLDPGIHHGAQEICGDDVDQNCDGDQNELDSVGCTVYYYDWDGDGYGRTDDSACYCEPRGMYNTEQPGDCNDNDSGIKPSSPEICFNGKDDNCDGDENSLNAIGCSVFYLDADHDGFGTGAPQCFCISRDDFTAKNDTDCDDGDALVNKNADEICNNGKDDDCDGVANEKNAVGCQNYYFDNDHDGWGTAAYECLCAPDSPFSAPQLGDCNDAAPTTYPTADEICNGVDDNCNGAVDEDAAAAMGCTPDHGTGGCNVQCFIQSCDSTWYNVNGNYDDGCECQEDGINNDCADPIGLGTLNDGASGSTGPSAAASGSIVPAGDTDWFSFAAPDSADSSCDNYHVRVRFTSNPGGQFAFAVYRNSCSTNVCGTATDFRWYNDFYDATLANTNNHGECPCSKNKNVNGPSNPPDRGACSDNSATYYVQVFRKPGYTATCDDYTIEVSNGLYDAGSP